MFLSVTGDLLGETVSLDGISAGSPQFSGDGLFAACTHNVGGNTGHFSLFDLSTLGSGTPLEVEYTQEVPDVKFSPVGYVMGF